MQNGFVNTSMKNLKRLYKGNDKMVDFLMNL